MDLTLQLGRDDSYNLIAKVGGAVLDLTGSTVYAVCKQVQDLGAPAIFTKSSGDGSLTIASGTAGTFSFLVTAADRATMSDFVQYYWEVLVVKANGTAVTPDGFEGAVTVTPALMQKP
jgi:hypothetical protein